MKVKIRAFGIAKDIVGHPLTYLEVPPSATIDNVKEILTSEFPEFESLRKFSIAVNEEYQENDFVIKEGDELVIIPPVSGG